MYQCLCINKYPHFWLTATITSQGSSLSSLPCRYACAAIATRFEGIIKPPFVSLLRPFELPMVEHKGRKRACAFLPSVATFEVSNVSEGDCFAALQIVYPPCGGRRISRLSLPLGVFASPWVANPRKGRLPPPYRFNCLWDSSFLSSFHDLRLLYSA